MKAESEHARPISRPDLGEPILMRYLQERTRAMAPAHHEQMPVVRSTKPYGTTARNRNAAKMAKCTMP
jgi:hypothetical protein